MILLAHMLFGAAIGHIVKSMPMAIILAFSSHYFLDLFPHVEYNIENIQKKQWKRAFPQFLAVLLDFLTGILLISLLSDNRAIIYICAFLAVAPDGFSFLESIIKTGLLKRHNQFHKDKIHFLKNKKISNFWRITSQVLAVIISVIILKS